MSPDLSVLSPSQNESLSPGGHLFPIPGQTVVREADINQIPHCKGKLQLGEVSKVT